MIKYALMVLVLGCFGYIGMGIGKYYFKKQVFYENLIDFCNLLLSEISFLKSDLISVCKRVSLNTNTEFSNVLIAYVSKLTDEKSEDDVFNKYLDKLFLTKNEVYYLKGFFNSLGKTGINEQIDLVNYYLNVFNQHLKDSTKNNEKYAPLFKKMGWIVGLLVCIVLI